MHDIIKKDQIFAAYRLAGRSRLLAEEFLCFMQPLAI